MAVDKPESCAACGQPTTPGARFCANCGAALARRCPSCGTEAAANATFCHSCGNRLVDTPEPARPPVSGGERRQLTVAFCDLVGSTALSSRLDAEEYSELIGTYQARAVGAATRYGGTVENYLGDGIVFRFGWPEAHDDDPERAIRAGLEIVDTIRELSAEAGSEDALAVRIGIHTGPAVIAEGGGGEQGATAIGETLNLAARLQGTAEPEMVVISGDTLELVRGIFLTEDLGSRALRGFSEPVHAYRAVQPSGVRSRLDAVGDALTPLVGREVELALLVSRWKAARQHRGQVVLISGEAGIGKSRLIYELRGRLESPSHSWLECRCSAYTSSSAFQPAIELIEQGLSLSPDDSSEAKLEKLWRGLRAAGVEDDDAVALLGLLLSIPSEQGLGPLTMSPERRRRRTIAVVLEWILCLARLQPTVLLVEDLHWCDPSSMELIGELIAHNRGSQLMLIATARPEFVPPWAAKPHVTNLPISPFSEPEVEQMVASMAGGRRVPAELLQRITTETAGNPLFTEEVSRTVLESDLLEERGGDLTLKAPLVEFDIPATLQGTLTARLDRLSAAKPVAQLASVIGHEFSYGLLNEVAELDEAMLREGLERLVESELLFQAGQPPRSTYTFKHALIQDAAYQSLLKRTRRELHERIADAMGRRSGDSSDAPPELAARHYELAGRIEPAIAGYRRAAETAAERSGHSEALAHLRKAIGLCAKLPEGTERIRLEVELQMALGASVIATSSYADPAIEQAYGRARELCERLGDEAEVAYALAGLSIYRLNKGEVGLGAELAERVLEIGQLEDDDTLCLLGHIQLALALILRAEFDTGLEHCERAAEIYEPEQHGWLAYRFGTDHGVVAECFAAYCLMGQGYLDQAIERHHRAEKLARELGHSFSLAYALFLQTTIHWVRGDEQAERRAAQVALKLGTEEGFDLWKGLASVFLGAQRARSSGDPATIPAIIEASMVAGETGNRAMSTPVLACVAGAQRAVGNLAEAVGTVDAALAVSVETDQPWWDSDLVRLKGELSLEQAASAGGSAGTGEQAEGLFRNALEIAAEQGSATLGLRAATSLARLISGQDREEEALQLLAPLYERFGEGFDTLPLREAREVLAGLGAAPPQPAPQADQAGANPRFE
jgi:class 3 adenylate cyclase/predicted ATPase